LANLQCCVYPEWNFGGPSALFETGGGRGFLLDDGTLTYQRENIFESYYNLHLWRGIFTGVDMRHINNPGYNRDRRPVLVAGARFHREF